MLAERLNYEFLSIGNIAREFAGKEYRRNDDMRQRFIKKFGIDFTYKNNYDLIININRKTKKQTLEQIIKVVKNKLEGDA